jgi:cation:H+ antiporter
MTVFINCLALLILLCLLGVAADIVVRNIKRLTLILELKLFALGSLLGLIATLPELAVGINATINNVSTISIGNLLGGILFIFGVVLGVGLILNKKIETDGKLKSILPKAMIIFLPIILGLDGKYGFWDGVIIIVSYIGIIFYIARSNLKYLYKTDREKIKHYSTARVVFLSIVGLVLVILISSWALMITIDILKQFKVSELALGIVIFSIGTNLPEIMIIAVSWYKKIPELSLSSLMGSALANIFVLGILAVIKPIEFVADYSFAILGTFLGLMIIMVTIFYCSDKKMDRQEGAVLFCVYILFLIVNFVIIKLQIVPGFS